MKQAFAISLFALLTANGFNAWAQQKNVARNKPVWVSSEDKSFPSSKITDGVISRNSKWQASSNKAPHTVEIDLKKYYNLTGITVHSGITDQEKKADEMNQAAGFWSVKNFKLQYWDDANWTDFPKAEIHENRLVAAPFNFSPAITTYKIRLVCDDGEPISIMEIEAFGQEAPNMPLPPTVSQTAQKTSKGNKPQQAKITVTNKNVGKTMKYVGYNQGYYFPGSNVSGWLEYADVNSVRVWATLNAFVPTSAVQVDNVGSVEEFDKRKSELRQAPENNRFIKWQQLTPLYDKPDSSSTNAMVFNYALTELKRLGIDVILQIGSTDFKDDWQNKWMQWQRYYALAYHSAKVGDVTMFAMQNEPNHRNSGPMKLDQWITGAQVVSDAIHCAVADVSKAYGKNLQGKFVGPVTAGQNTDWWAAIAKANHTDYHGKAIEGKVVDLFSTHSYNSPAAGYESRISNIKKILADNDANHQPLPVMYTEIGRWMNAYLIDKEETMDSPSLFTEWAGIYANNMKNGGYGMWAFKFANTVSGPYPHGIKSGHHYIWQGRRIVEDAHVNLALNKPVKANANSSNASLITDGNKSDDSAWQSGAGSEKWLEIDLGKPTELGSAVVYTGSAYGVYTSPDRIKNFALQYWENNGWKNIPGMEEKGSKYSQIFNVFKKSVTTTKVRFVSTDEGNVKVREIKLFAKGDEPSEQPDYNVAGIQRTGEVVRLFAKGFKNERKLLQTQSTAADDSDLDTYTCYDDASGNYYMWLVQRSLQNYQLNIDLAKLKVAAGTPVTVETVNNDNYGEATQLLSMTNTGTVNLTMPPQSVMLVTIPSNIKSVAGTMLNASAAATVKGGKSVGHNFGSAANLAVQLDAAKPENNQVSYIQFTVPAGKAAKMKRAVLAVSGNVNTGNKPYRLHVYGIPHQSAWSASTINWNNALQLDGKEALVKNVGKDAFVAGEIAFNKTNKYHYLDVTSLLKKHPNAHVSFVLVRETWQLGDDEDKGRVVTLSKTGAKPLLKIWE